MVKLRILKSKKNPRLYRLLLVNVWISKFYRFILINSMVYKIIRNNTDYYFIVVRAFINDKL